MPHFMSRSGLTATNAVRFLSLFNTAIERMENYEQGNINNPDFLTSHQPYSLSYTTLRVYICDALTYICNADNYKRLTVDLGYEMKYSLEVYQKLKAVIKFTIEEFNIKVKFKNLYVKADKQQVVVKSLHEMEINLQEITDSNTNTDVNWELELDNFCKQTLQDQLIIENIKLNSDSRESLLKKLNDLKKSKLISEFNLVEDTLLVNK